MSAAMVALPNTVRSALGARLRVAQEEANQQARIACLLLIERKHEQAEVHAARHAEAMLRVAELAAEVRAAARREAVA